jgi:TonB family protein
MRLIVLALAMTFAGVVPAAADQAVLQKVRELYAAAAYEDALAVVKSIPEASRPPQIDQYQVFCLLALGQEQQAHAAIERLLTSDPLYQPDPVETSPRLVQAFADARARLLPVVTKALYTDAKLALEQKDRAKATEGFEQLLRVIEGAPADPTLADMKVLASGFLELSRALPPPVEAKPIPADASAATPSTSTNGNGATGPATADSDSDNATTSSPVAIKQDFPAWTLPDAASRRSQFNGLLRLRVGADGRVESAELLQRVHPAYDQQLLRAAQNWRYEPARQKNGVAVPAEVVVQVRLRPQE